MRLRHPIDDQRDRSLRRICWVCACVYAVFVIAEVSVALCSGC